MSMDDYLYETDKKLLESCGYLPYEGAYGYELNGRNGEHCRMRFIGKIGYLGAFAVLDMDTKRLHSIRLEVLQPKSGASDGLVLKKNLMPTPPDEIVISDFSREFEHEFIKIEREADWKMMDCMVKFTPPKTKFELVFRIKKD